MFQSIPVITTVSDQYLNQLPLKLFSFIRENSPSFEVPWKRAELIGSMFKGVSIHWIIQVHRNNLQYITLVWFHLLLYSLNYFPAVLMAQKIKNA